MLFLANLKFLKLLRFNRRVSMFSDTIRRSRLELSYFSIVFACVYIGIVGALYMLLKSTHFLLLPDICLSDLAY